MAHPPNARRAAARLVSAVLDERRTLDDALAETAAFNALSGRDRAFARAIASATLRRLGGIDAVLAHFLAKPLPDTAIAARALLRTAAAQLLAMGAAPHAVVSETVTLANAERGARGFAGLMNAVLRKVATDGPALLDALPAGADLPIGCTPAGAPPMAPTPPPPSPPGCTPKPRSISASRPTPPNGPNDLAARYSKPAACGSPIRARSRSFRALKRATGGCRTPPPACRS
jgi:transcription termination factor NusB